MKLNIGCGSRVKEGWVNVDSYERPNAKLDHVIDVTKEWIWKNESLDYIYAEQFLEHLTWIEGLIFLHNCFMSLKKGGILRLVIPHYHKIFQKYIFGDKEFFKIFFDELNGSDYDYYYSIWTEPVRIKEERKDNPPPEWHTSSRVKDRLRVKERVRKYEYPIEILDWFCHQYGEHKCLYDLTSLRNKLYQRGFLEVRETEISDLDSTAPSRITSSLYVEAIK